MEADIKTYLLYVNAAVHGNAALRCTVTPKVHLMLKHVAWQMQNIRGGLGDKMDDWVERLHQTRMRLRQHFCTAQNPVVRANARKKASSRSSHPDEITHTDKTTAWNKRSFSVAKIDDAISTHRKKQHDQGQYKAVKYSVKGGEYESTYMVGVNI